MIYAQKGNKQRQIAESDIQTYVEQGYKIVDGHGTVLQETVPTDLPTLKTAYKQHVVEIKALKARVKELSEQVNTLSTVREKTEKEERPTNDGLLDKEPVEKKPRTRKA